MFSKLTNFVNQSRRMFYMFYKPHADEYKQILKVTGLGIIVIGVIGLIVYFLFQILGI